MKILKFLLLGFLFAPFLFRLDTAQNNSRDTLIINQYIKSFGQSFIAQHNNIYLIKLFMNNPHITGPSHILSFVLKEQGNKTNLAEIHFTSANIGQNYTLPLQFAPVSDSKGKTFILEISAPEQSTSSALEARYSLKNVYQKGNGFVNGKPIRGDFAFKVYYKTSPLNFLKDSWQDFSDRINKDRIFIIIYMGLVITILGLMAIKI